MAEKVATFSFPASGGLTLNTDELTQGQTMPGSAIRLINFEPSPKGGYRRISGYSKYVATEVPGVGRILGVKVFLGGVLAARAVDGSTSRLYYGDGSSWTAVRSALTGIKEHRFHQFSIVRDTVAICDGTSKPYLWDGTTLTELTGGPVGAISAAEFKQHVFYAKGQSVFFTAPGDQTNFSAVDGGGEINVGDAIVELRPFRDQLIIFGENSVQRIVGSSAFDFRLIPVTKNLGCLAAGSVQEIGGDLVFLSADGLRPVGASDRIGDFELESISKPVQSLLASRISGYRGNQISSCLIRDKTQYRLLFGKDSDTDTVAPGLVGALNGGTGSGLGWSFGELRGIRAACADSDVTANTEIVVHGGYDGFVYRQEIGSTFNGLSVPYRYTTPFINFGDSFIRKTLLNAKIFVEKEGSNDITLQVNYNSGEPFLVQPNPQPFVDSYDGGSVFGGSFFGTAIFSQIQTYALKQTLVGSGQTASFDFYGNNAGSPFTIKTVTLEYIPGGRR